MRTTWDAARVMAILAALKDHGVTVTQMTRASGANRSTVYRWMSGGGGQPDYNLINGLARGVWRKHPGLARDLVEASGYAWAEPQDVPEPVPELDDDPETLEALRSAYRDNPSMVREAARALVEAEATERSEAERSSPARRAG